jgi:hypothetical protein
MATVTKANDWMVRFSAPSLTVPWLESTPPIAHFLRAMRTPYPRAEHAVEVGDVEIDERIVDKGREALWARMPFEETWLTCECSAGDFYRPKLRCP